jgi:uncharacterized membrane protein
MGAGHSHDLGERPRASQRTTEVLAIAVGIVLFLTVAGAVAVWPTDYSFRGSIPTLGPGDEWVTAVIVAVDPVTGVADAEIVGREQDGVVQMDPPYWSDVAFEVGDSITALRISTGQVIFTDYERGPSLLILLILYVAVVLIVARWRGLGALVGLAAAFGVVIFFTVPALYNGGDPLIVALVTGSGALMCLLYIAHGINARTTTAYLGTVAGLAVTAALANWAVGASNLTGLWSEDGIHLELSGRGVSLQGLVLCGVVLAGLGVLNDVTITQASATWELRAARPDMGRAQLFARGMRIGRDHIASTVYTIAFAYVGAALPTIMLISLYDSTLAQTLTSTDIAEEIVRTLVGSIGLVLAVPLTTGIAAAVLGEGAVAGSHEETSEV